LEFFHWPLVSQTDGGGVGTGEGEDAAPRATQSTCRLAALTPLLEKLNQHEGGGSCSKILTSSP